MEVWVEVPEVFWTVRQADDGTQNIVVPFTDLQKLRDWMSERVFEIDVHLRRQP